MAPSAAQLGRQADLVGLALDDLVLAGGDVGQVRVAPLARGERQRAGGRRRDGRRGASPSSSRRGRGEPGLGGGDAVRVGERDQVDAALVVVEGDQPVAEHERGIGQRRAVRELAAALGLELVAEVAGVAAGEVERQLRGVGAQARELALAVVEDALAPLLPPVGPVDREQPRGDVVAHDVAERAVGGAHEREAREPGPQPRAVQPDGVVAVAVERGERDFGIAPRVERAVVDADAGGRSARVSRARAPATAGARASGRGSCAPACARARSRSTRGGTARPTGAARGARAP